ncbi:hypothetical protein [Vibrio cholerae]|uniref:hypothetical protein n=1 Tax=Vibrio cholerae TaxID=666 RepID=UPI000ABA1DAE|nr:hypothetical protein [Vibrio cholerae]
MKRFDIALYDFDKDGFPIISRLAKAYKGNRFEDDLSEEEIEHREILHQQSTLVELIKRNPIAFRKALDSLDKKSLGIVVKRKWDEDKVVLKYCEDDDTDDDLF